MACPALSYRPRRPRESPLYPLPENLDLTPIAEDFRRATLRALRRREAISEELADKVLCWDHHGGFSVDPAGVSVYVYSPIEVSDEFKNYFKKHVGRK